MRKLFLAGLLAGASIFAASGTASACDEWYGYGAGYYGYAPRAYAYAPRVYAYAGPRVYAYTPGPRVYGYAYYGYAPRVDTYYYGPGWGRRW
jgi:hypothetical protein